ncbi:MAG: LptA/OstA family protein [Armatimonadota bacterium]|nr:hypothetical protein [bacterium]
MRNKITAVLGAVTVLVMAISFANVSAQQAPKTATAKAAKQKDTVIGKADMLKSHWGDNKTTLMKGNVSFTHGDTVIASDQVEYDETSKSAVSPGALTITDPECDISGDKGSAYFKKKLSIVEGNVVMHVKPKLTEQEKSAQKDKDSKDVKAKLKEPTMITCKRLEYLYKDKVATAIGGVFFKQPKRTASADRAIYDEKDELLTLIGNVKGTDEEGQTFAAPEKVVISLKKGDEWMEAPHANATFKIDLDEE